MLRRFLLAIWLALAGLTMTATTAAATTTFAQEADVGDVNSIVTAVYIGALALTASKATSLVKYLVARDVNAVVTQLVAALVGVALIWTASEATGFQSLPTADGTPIGELNPGGLILWGIVFGFTGSFAYDWKKARDDSDSAAEPALLASARTTRGRRGERPLVADRPHG